VEKEMENDEGRKQTRAIADAMMKSVGVESEKDKVQSAPTKHVERKTTYTTRSNPAPIRRSAPKSAVVVPRRDRQDQQPVINEGSLRSQFPLLRESVVADLDLAFIARKLHFALIDALEAHNLIICGGDEAIDLRDASCPIMAKAAAQVIDGIVANDWMRKTK
jgi:hypothetical protein